MGRKWLWLVGTVLVITPSTIATADYFPWHFQKTPDRRPAYSQPKTSPQQTARDASNALNAQGINLLKSGNREEAIEKFRLAAVADPTNFVAQGNYYGQKAAKEFDDGNLESALKDGQEATKYDSAYSGLIDSIHARLKEQAELGSIKRTTEESIAHVQNQELENLAQDAQLATARVEAKTRSLQEQDRVASSNYDSNVVDARVVKQYGEVIAGIPELAHSPGAETARKGFVAVANHDWVLARAYYKDALNHDPGNPVLKRSVDLAEWMVAWSGQHNIPAVNPNNIRPTINGDRASAQELVRLYRDLANRLSVDAHIQDVMGDPVGSRKRAQAADWMRAEADLYDAASK